MYMTQSLFDHSKTVLMFLGLSESCQSLTVRHIMSKIRTLIDFLLFLGEYYSPKIFKKFYCSS